MLKGKGAVAKHLPSRELIIARWLPPATSPDIAPLCFQLYLLYLQCSVLFNQLADTLAVFILLGIKLVYLGIKFHYPVFLFSYSSFHSAAYKVILSASAFLASAAALRFFES